MGGDWKAKAEAKRQAILDSIPQKWRLAKVPTVQDQKDVTGAYIQQFLNEREIEITETDAVGVAKHTTSGNWTAVEVADAFCHRAAIAHQLVNCLHETFFDAALADAKALDDYFAKNKKPIGLLHGVPVSLKDQFHVKNVETTMGYVGWIGTFEGKEGDRRYRNFESEIVRELRKLGAVLYVKTAVPHTLMSGETVNHIIGYSQNPKNRYLTAGGSSGGEGALIGLKGSPVGFGTDIGGSVRIPAAFNGLYGLRPSSGRLPYQGVANSMDGQNSILSVVGPLGGTAQSIALATKAVLSTSPWLYDPLVVDMPWRDNEAGEVHTHRSNLTFAVLRSDGEATPDPPVARAVELTVAALEKAGHKVIEWKPPSHKRLLEITFKTWLYDGGADVHRAFGLSGEPLTPQIVMTYGEKAGEEATATQIATNNVDKREFQKEYLDYWNSTASLTGTGKPVDGVISPLAPYPAARPERYRYYGFSAWVNGLDYTAVTVPVTQAAKNIDRYPSNYTPANETDKEIYDSYDAEIYDGAHVGVQIVGPRFTEEKMLAIAEYVGGLLGK
ncbi:hypothetical protein DV736_g172, partial [Chaetothyriales sp. CBS 134916]